jgi:hypothetical protein
MRSRFNIKKWFEERARQKADAVIKMVMQGHREMPVRLGKNALKRQARRGARLRDFLPTTLGEEAGGIFSSGRSFIEALKKRGYSTLGTGAHATVLAKEGSNRVIKVLRQPADGWMEYIKWADDMGFTGTFAPKVYSYKYIKGKESDFAIASMERLGLTLSRVKHDHPMSPIQALLPYVTHHNNDNAKKMLDFVLPGMSTFSAALGAKFGRHSFDMHPGNLMLRNNAQFVVVDPVAGCSGENTMKRFKARGAIPLAA